MRSEAIQQLEPLVGEWTLTLFNAWFIDDPDARLQGDATISWLGEAFLEMRATFADDQGNWHWVIGRSDADEKFVLLYYDERGTMRVFDMTFSDGHWRLLREDPDFHQRFIATVATDRIEARFEASEDEGTTWRKDFDMSFARRAT